MQEVLWTASTEQYVFLVAAESASTTVLAYVPTQFGYLECGMIQVESHWPVEAAGSRPAQ